MKPTHPPPIIAEAFRMACSRVISETACLVSDSREASITLGDAIAARIGESVLRRIGNRPDSWPVEWDDLRYLLAETMRACLEELERHEQQ